MKRLLLMVYLVTAATGVQAARQYRDFTDTKGRTIRGCIVAYDEKTEIVTFERDNRKIAKVPITIFSETDRKYINIWKNQKGVSSSSKFKISCDRRVIKNWNEEQMGTISYSNGSRERDQVVGKTYFKETGYEILFANRNSYAVTDLILEYCIYYEQEVNNGEDARQGVLFGSVTIDKLAQNERKKILTNSVVTFKDESNSEFLNARVLKGEVFGISMRLYLQDGNEKTLVREVAVPDSIPNSYEWFSESRPVGDN